MPQIEIDFEVYKELTSRRDTESVTCNDVIRRALALPTRAESANDGGPSNDIPWNVSDASIPAGSMLRAHYKGKTYIGFVRAGRFELDSGEIFSTPSAAAVHITKTNVNGWRFWRCKQPGDAEYVLLERLRGKR